MKLATPPTQPLNDTIAKPGTLYYLIRHRSRACATLGITEEVFRRVRYPHGPYGYRRSRTTTAWRHKAWHWMLNNNIEGLDRAPSYSEVAQATGCECHSTIVSAMLVGMKAREKRERKGKQ